MKTNGLLYSYSYSFTYRFARRRKENQSNEFVGLDDRLNRRKINSFWACENQFARRVGTKYIIYS